MVEYSKMENMGNEKQTLLYGEFEEKGVEKICVSDHINGLQYTSTKSDSVVVDMERLSHIIEIDMKANSRINLQRNLSRKGSMRSGERKTNSNASNEKDTNLTATSPKASLLVGRSTPEKPMTLTTVGTASDHQTTPQTHNQITTVATGHADATATESKVGGKRYSFGRSTSSPSWTIDPRRILFFFATLSSMGTILLIYFTLSMAKLNGEGSALNE